MTKDQDKKKSGEQVEGLDFIRKAVTEDLASGRFDAIKTRFPPEPNGYLHIGHAKALCIDFGIADEFGGECNLRFDDTNPVKEESEYVEAIMEDIRWLGFDWGDRLFYASDYFGQLYDYAVKLIRDGKAYVCDLSVEEIREYRGTLTEAGRPSPWRDRSVEENLDLFERMKQGEFPDGFRTLRAKIDMGSSNMNLRDPVMYRILHEVHHRTGDTWKIYPMYDFAHGQSDSIEMISHSLCSLEYEIHRPLYDWFCQNLEIFHPRQIEFARLNLSYTVMSKRKLLLLVKGGHVSGWDDPRMPTLSGLRRRGYSPEAIKVFCERIGVNKMDSTVDIALLEHCLRDDLNKRASRRMVVLDPIKMVITNWPAGTSETLEADNNPEDENSGKREIRFSGELWIERDDVSENPPPKYRRLAIGREVRLKHGYYVTCNEILKDEKGRISEVRCTYDPKTRGGWSEDGRKVLGTIHWLAVEDAIDLEVRLYDRLFKEEKPEADGGDFIAKLNPDSLKILGTAKGEPALAGASLGEYFQFLRQGYFALDADSSPENPIFNLTVRLRDSWKK